jgi:hypothetical protein
MTDLYTTTAVVLALILIFGFRERILARLKRFDDSNRVRRQQEQMDRHDRLAHFRHTMNLAEEMVEPIGEIVEPDARTGTPVKIWLFEGERYLSRDEAEAARNESIVLKAREFYKDLPRALTERRGGKIK